MGERPLVWVQVMRLVEEGICSNAGTGAAAKKCGNRLPAPVRACRALLEGTDEGAVAGRGCPHTDIADALGRNEAQVCKKRRREIESGRRLGFPGFGNSDLLLFSRSRGFGGGFFL